MPTSVPRHESIEALLAEALPGEDAEAIIRRKARAVIAKHRHLWKGPPFCPEELADLEGVIVEEAPCDIRSHGRIFPRGSQVVIQYAKAQCEERKRFTISHELAHTLFPDCYKRERRRTPAGKAEWEFENLCNIGASEFLFPLEEFSAAIGKTFLAAPQLQALATSYKASIDATARRAVGLLTVPACVVFAKYQPPTGRSVVSLSVQYAAPNSQFPHRIYRNLKINSKSVANLAHREGIPFSSRSENWMIGRQWVRFRAEAVPLPKFDSAEAADVAILLYLN